MRTDKDRQTDRQTHTHRRTRSSQYSASLPGGSNNKLIKLYVQMSDLHMPRLRNSSRPTQSPNGRVGMKEELVAGIRAEAVSLDPLRTPELTDLSQIRSLRSADVLACATRRTRKRLGDRSYSVARPCLCNSLPVTLRNTDVSLLQFKRLLKTHWFVHMGCAA